MKNIFKSYHLLLESRGSFKVTDDREELIIEAGVTQTIQEKIWGRYRSDILALHSSNFVNTSYQFTSNGINEGQLLFPFLRKNSLQLLDTTGHNENFVLRNKWLENEFWLVKENIWEPHIIFATDTLTMNKSYKIQLSEHYKTNVPLTHILFCVGFLLSRKLKRQFISLGG